MKIRILKSDELVRDVGIIYLYQMLREMDKDNQIRPELHRNHLGFNLPENFDLCEALFAQITGKLYQAFISNLKVEKLETDLIDKLKEAPKEQLVEILEDHKVPPAKIKKIIDSSKNIFFPYIRNNAKFGWNAKKVENFHTNLKELIQLFSDGLLNQRERIDLYGKGGYCSVCQENIAPFYDITHKYSIETVEELKKSQRVIRKDSKYLYSFRGSEDNTFANYGRINQPSTICFECEFFNLLFLLYVKMERPKKFILANSLETTYSLQQELMIKEDTYTLQGFYAHFANLGRSSKFRLYQISIDAKKGILLQSQEIIDYENLGLQLKLMDMVDEFSFPEPVQNRYELIDLLKKYILNKNYHGAYQILLNNAVVESESLLANNYKILEEFLLETTN